jgi:hypothetical protein
MQSSLRSLRAMGHLGTSAIVNALSGVMAGAIYRAPPSAMADAPPMITDAHAAPEAIHRPILR